MPLHHLTVRVRPTPAALMDRMATRVSAFSWKLLTRRWRCVGSVDPSIRMKLDGAGEEGGLK